MIKNLNPENERLKRRYFSFLTDTKGKNTKTIDKVAAALAAFEKSTKWRPFRNFHIEQAKAFKRYLAAQKNQRTGKALGEGTICSTLLHVRAFFIWLAEQPGFRSKITCLDADYFNPPKETRQKARAQGFAKGPTIDQVNMVLEQMPHGTPIEKRNRALFAFTLLTGSRAGATASLKLKHVNITECRVFMDAREVKTKNAKTFTTWFFPVGAHVRTIFEDWVDFLLHDQLFGPEHPLFPRSLVKQNAAKRFGIVVLDCQPWSTTRSIEDIFKAAFKAANLPYFNPHSFRNTLTRLGYEVCRGDMKALKVWSQNLGHEQMVTTYLNRPGFTGE